jgi:hypothetical protein
MPPRRVTPPAKQRMTWRSLAEHRWWLGGGAAILVAVLTWALWPTSTPPPRARQYLDFTACLLTGEQGINEPDATPVWNGLQQASLATKAKVQYLAVTGPQTVDNAATFVATLAQTNCDLVFAAGDIPVTSVNQSAPTFPNTRFLIVHGTATHSNVSIVDGQTPQQITAAVNQIVTNAVP